LASLIALYTKPEDVEGFESYYRDTHGPLAEALPGVKEISVARILGTPRGTEATYHIRAELTFGSTEDMTAALQGEEGRTMGRDAMEMCQRFGIDAEIMLADEF
jgi:uncharacterized protein (TIGR02118 family)